MLTPGPGRTNVLRNPFLRDEEIADYQQELKITIAENDTTDFEKTHSINYFLITLRRQGREERRKKRKEESECVGSGKCTLWETGAPNRKGLRGVRVSHGPKSGLWETPGPD